MTGNEFTVFSKRQKCLVVQYNNSDNLTHYFIVLHIWGGGVDSSHPLPPSIFIATALLVPPTHPVW